jgi:hypothetical protein
MPTDTDEKLDQLIAEQRRTNELLARQNAPKKSRLCSEGKRGTCFGPWYTCLIFGCAGRQPKY